MSYCIQCGKILPDGARFCPDCGTQQTAIESDNANLAEKIRNAASWESKQESAEVTDSNNSSTGRTQPEADTEAANQQYIKQLERELRLQKEAEEIKRKAEEETFRKQKEEALRAEKERERLAEEARAEREHRRFCNFIQSDYNDANASYKLRYQERLHECKHRMNGEQVLMLPLVNRIGKLAFANLPMSITKDTTLLIEAGIKEIASDAFTGSKFSSIKFTYLPNQIDENAFRNVDTSKIQVPRNLYKRLIKMTNIPKGIKIEKTVDNLPFPWAKWLIIWGLYIPMAIYFFKNIGYLVQRFTPFSLQSIWGVIIGTLGAFIIMGLGAIIFAIFFREASDRIK